MKCISHLTVISIHFANGFQIKTTLKISAKYLNIWVELDWIENIIPIIISHIFISFDWLLLLYFGIIADLCSD